MNIYKWFIHSYKSRIYTVGHDRAWHNVYIQTNHIYACKNNSLMYIRKSLKYIQHACSGMALTGREAAGFLPSLTTLRGVEFKWSVGEGSVTALVKILESQFHSYFLWQMKQRADFERKKEKKKDFRDIARCQSHGVCECRICYRTRNFYVEILRSQLYVFWVKFSEVSSVDISWNIYRADFNS